MPRISKKMFVNAGAKGGLATKKKYGKDHFKMLAQKSVAKRQAKSNNCPIHQSSKDVCDFLHTKYKNFNQRSGK